MYGLKHPGMNSLRQRGNTLQSIHSGSTVFSADTTDLPIAAGIFKITES